MLLLLRRRRRRRHGQRRLRARRPVFGVARRLVIDVLHVRRDGHLSELDDGFPLDDVVDEAGLRHRSVVQT